MPALPVPEFRSYLRRPLPHPLTHKTYRQIAKDIGIPASTVNRFLNNPEDLTKRHMDALLGAYGLEWHTLFLLREYTPEIRLGRPVQVDPRNPDYDTAGNPLDPTNPDTDTPKRKGLFGRLTTPLGPDEQRTPPPNLNPDQLYEPQTPAQKRAGVPLVKRKMTRDEFSSYDPEPQIIHPDHLKDSTPDWKDWTNPVWSWWDWRLNTRPGDSSDSNKEAYARTTAAASRASAEFGGDETDRTRIQRTARSDEIYQALIHNQPIPPFDPADPRYVCEPAEPRRRGKGKKNKQPKDRTDSQ